MVRTFGLSGEPDIETAKSLFDRHGGDPPSDLKKGTSPAVLKEVFLVAAPRLFYFQRAERYTKLEALLSGKTPVCN